MADMIRIATIRTPLHLGPVWFLGAGNFGPPNTATAGAGLRLEAAKPPSTDSTANRLQPHQRPADAAAGRS